MNFMCIFQKSWLYVARKKYQQPTKGAVIKYLRGGAGGNFQIFEKISVAPQTHQKKFQDPPVNWLKFSQPPHQLFKIFVAPLEVPKNFHGPPLS